MISGCWCVFIHISSLQLRKTWCKFVFIIKIKISVVFCYGYNQKCQKFYTTINTTLQLGRLFWRHLHYAFFILSLFFPVCFVVYYYYYWGWGWGASASHIYNYYTLGLLSIYQSIYFFSTFLGPSRSSNSLSWKAQTSSSISGVQPRDVISSAWPGSAPGPPSSETCPKHACLTSTSQMAVPSWSRVFLLKGSFSWINWRLSWSSDSWPTVWGVLDFLLLFIYY